MKLSLVVLAPPRLEGRVVPVRITPFLIGRDPACHLRPSSLTVSGRHCLLGTRSGSPFVRDLDSTNGTWVNGKLIEGPIDLQDQDEIQVGPLRFAVRIETPVPIAEQAHEQPDVHQPTILPLSGVLPGVGAVPMGDTKVQPALPPEAARPSRPCCWGLFQFLRRRPRP